MHSNAMRRNFQPKASPIDAHTAPKNCQPALPLDDAAVRKKPLAVQNEGIATAFITCSFKKQRSQRTLAFESAGF